MPKDLEWFGGSSTKVLSNFALDLLSDFFFFFFFFIKKVKEGSLYKFSQLKDC